MADHVDENAGTPENKSLDQSAIDEAIAAMQMNGTETGQAAGETASDKDASGIGESKDTDGVEESSVLANGGETFGEAVSDGQEDLDAAIAAIQEGVSEELDRETAAKTDESESDNVDQEDIDAAIAAMQVETTEEAGVAAADESGAENVGQENIDAAIAAMQAGASNDDEVAAEEDSSRENVGQEDIDAAMAALQADGVEDDGTDTEDDSDSTDDDEAEPEIEAAATDSLVDDGDPQPSDAEDESVVYDSAEDKGDADLNSQSPSPETVDSKKEESEGKRGIETGAPEPETVSGEDNTFSDLEEGDLEEPEPVPVMTEAEELAAMTASFDEDQDFSGMDEEDTELASAIANDEPADAVTESSGYTEALVDQKSASKKRADRTKAGSGTKAPAREKSGSKKKYVGILVIGATIIIGLSVILGPDYYVSWKSRHEEQQPQTAPTDQVASVPAPAAPAVKVTSQNPHQEKLQEVARLRADLLAKKDEIDQLKLFYRDGISELEEELQQEATRYKVQTLDQAIKNHQIELDLRSIQRRWAYIDELEKPSRWLYQGSEELLFLSRRAQIDLQMNTIAQGIELTKHIRHLNASMQKYQLSPERLAIDLSDSRLRPLQDIWEAIDAENKAIAEHAVANGDRAIIAEICDGSTERIAELKTLTIRASKCLAQIQSSELFLNQLTSISPVAAKYLSAWSGQWLCLNGFRELSPDVARHLFKWDGDWISLNGLEAFPPQIGEMLLSWHGRQLELMGLVYNPEKMDRIGLQQLSDWEKSGGKLFVPENIRMEMNRLN